MNLLSFTEDELVNLYDTKIFADALSVKKKKNVCLKCAFNVSLMRLIFRVRTRNARA